MTAVIIDGPSIARSVRDDCRMQVSRLLPRVGLRPGSAVLNVGNDPASAIYLDNKIKACEQVGIGSFPYYLDRECDRKAVINTAQPHATATAF